MNLDSSPHIQLTTLVTEVPEQLESLTSFETFEETRIISSRLKCERMEEENLLCLISETFPLIRMLLSSVTAMCSKWTPSH
jgi:hypothetical protein